MDLGAVLRRRSTWVGGVVAIVLVLVVAPWVYLNVIRGEADERLTFDDVDSETNTDAEGSTETEADTETSDDAVATTTPTTAVPAAGIDGTWAATEASVAGYRVPETLFGQEVEGTGRTSEVEGTLVITGTIVEDASFTVDMASVTSDDDRRDGQFRGRIMDTDTHPTATFALTEPIELATVPADLEEQTVSATGELTVRGVTNTETFDLTTRRNGTTIEVNGAIPVDFDAYEIPDASGGPASVGRQGEIEVLLVFAPS